MSEEENLTKLIADSIEQIEAEERERKALTEAQKLEYDNLMATAIGFVLPQVRDFPLALLPYCSAARGPGHWDLEGNIEQLKKGWLPDHFIIYAPGLATVSFGISVVHGNHVTTGISFNGMGGTTTNWTKAIAEAARIEEQKRQNMAAYRISQSPQRPTDERLVELIREIARDVIGARGEE